MHGIYKKYVRICKNIKIQNDIKESKDKEYYFYCKGGVKSKKVASILSAYGYNTVLVLNQ